MILNHETIYPFLKAARGNWHNTLFIKCGHSRCPYGSPDVCKGFLFVAAADGTPLLVPAEEFETLTGEEISAEECRDVLWQYAFISAYAAYIEWHTISDSECPIKQLICETGKKF